MCPNSEHSDPSTVTEVTLIQAIGRIDVGNRACHNGRHAAGSLLRLLCLSPPKLKFHRGMYAVLGLGHPQCHSSALVLVNRSDKVPWGCWNFQSNGAQGKHDALILERLPLATGAQTMLGMCRHEHLTL